MFSEDQRYLSAALEKDKQVLSFTYLPAYARFLLEHHVHAFTVSQLAFMREAKLPLLRFFENIPDDVLVERGLAGTAEMLSYFSENKAPAFIENSVLKWLTNQLPTILRNQIESEDIILVNHVRRRNFRNFLSDYTSDRKVYDGVMDEIEKVTTRLDAICLNIQSNLQQQLYKDAQKLARIGNWIWNLPDKKLNWSEELYRIYELDPEKTEITNSLIGSFNHPDDDAYVQQTIADSILHKTPHDFYYRVILADQQEKILHARGEVRTDAAGNVYELFGTLQDVTIQQTAAKSIRDQQNFIKKIADVTPSLITVYNVNTRKYIFINQSIETILGYTVDEVMEKGIDFIISIMHPDDIVPLMEQNNRAMEEANVAAPAGGEPVVEFHYRLRHKTGGYRWFHTYGTVFDRDSDGKIKHLLNISIDNTEEYLLRRQFNEEKALAEMITEMSANRIVAFDTELRYIIWNKAAETFYKKSKEEVLGKFAFEIFPQFKDNHLMPYLQRAMDGEMIYLKEEKFFTEGWGQFYFIPLRKEDNSVFGVLSIVQDITEMKKKNNQLKELNDAFEHAEQIAKMSHWQWNIQQNKLYYSDNQYRLLGSEPQSFEPTLENFLRFVHPDDRHIVTQGGEKVLNDSNPQPAIFRVIRGDGSTRYFHSIGKMTVNEYGEEVLTGINMDITELYQLNLKLAQQNRQLEERNSELESFNFIASHDLQEPLRKIQSFSNRILEKEYENLSPEAQDYFDRMGLAATRMKQLIEDLITFSQLGHTSVETEQVDLDELFNETITSLGTENMDITIRMEKMPVIKVVPFQFRQVLQNILSNAIKYRKQDGPLVIEVKTKKVSAASIKQALPAEASGQFIQIAITDNGIGFEQKYADRIFELFQRLHTRHEYQGTGIGLAICKKVMQNHKGFITASGVPDKGSRFDLYVPA